MGREGQNKNSPKPFSKFLRMEKRCRAFERVGEAILPKSIYSESLSANNIRQVKASGTARLLESLPSVGISGSRELVDTRWTKSKPAEADTEWTGGHFPR